MRRPKSSKPISSSEGSSMCCILRKNSYQSLLKNLYKNMNDNKIKTNNRNNISALSIETHI